MKFAVVAPLAVAFFLFCYSELVGQNIGDFVSVEPTGQTQNLVIPSSHTFQRIIKSGNPLSLGGNLGADLDFSAFVPINGSNKNGYLCINTESKDAAECAILTLNFDPFIHLWAVQSGGKVSFPFSDLGVVSRFCSGAVTPDHHILVCEEDASSGDGNGDGYQDRGWILEIDPATRQVIDQDESGGPDKLWAMGRQIHENAAVKNNGAVVYWGADTYPNGYLYKFLPTVPGNYSDGQLYVLKTTSALGSGTWEQVPNSTQYDRNNTISNSAAIGAYNFDHIENVAMGTDSKIYFATSNSGRIIRFQDDGNTVNNLEVFVEPEDFDVDGDGPYDPEPWGTGADNIAFDGEGNLWVLQDGGRNHVWVVGPSHTSATPDVRLFATTPAGCEPTGISFTPDFRFMFITFQHPNNTNTSSQTDAAGQSVIFNIHTTVVIARKEFLGATALPVHFKYFSVERKAQEVSLKWIVAGARDHSYFSIERSSDNRMFEEIGRIESPIPEWGEHSFQFKDDNFPLGKDLFYRIRQCDQDGKCMFSETRRVRMNEKIMTVKLYPVPARDKLLVEFESTGNAVITLRIFSGTGILFKKTQIKLSPGRNYIPIPLLLLNNGVYALEISDEEGIQLLKKFIKM